MIRIGFAFLILAVAPLRGSVNAPNEKEIATLYARGLSGDQQAVIDCLAALERILAAQPNDQVARVYLGSTETLRSRDLPFGLAKWTMLRRGIAEMDAAAAAAPNDAEVQLLRAVTNEALPKVLGRAGIARSALDQLVTQVEKDPAKLKPHDQQLLYLNAGEAAQKAGETARAQQLWERGAALEADPRLTAEIRAALQQRGK